MAPLMQLPTYFEESYYSRDTYPCNCTHKSVSTYPSALAEYQARLDTVSDDLFQKDVSKVEVSFRDLKTNNGAGKNVDKRKIHTPEGVTNWLGIRQLHEGFNGDKPSKISIDRQDPKCRFISIYGNNSRARLNITRSMLTEILSFHQVFPEYLDFLFVFGLQSELQDLRFSSFRVQRSLRKECTSFGIDSLARSGRQYQLCYNLKGVTAKYRDKKNSLNTEYSIRPAAFYHRFDIENGNALWIVTKGGTDVEERFKELTGKDARPEDKSFGNLEECFKSSLSAHLLFCHWSTEDWRGYIKWLEQVVEKETGMAIMGPARHHAYTTSDIQRLLTLEESINEVITVLESNIDVINALKIFYEKLGTHNDFTLQQCNYDIEDFVSQLEQIMYDFKLQVGRSKALGKIMTNRTELVKQHRIERLNRNLEKEAIVMRIVTIVTLIYLPATFVSTFFSTDIIKYQDQNSPNGNYSPLAMKRWLQVTLPLTVLTLTLAYVTKQFTERRLNPQLEAVERVDDLLGPKAQQGSIHSGSLHESNGSSQHEGKTLTMPSWWGDDRWRTWAGEAAKTLKWWHPKQMIARTRGQPAPGLPMHMHHLHPQAGNPP